MRHDLHDLGARRGDGVRGDRAAATASRTAYRGPASAAEIASDPELEPQVTIVRRDRETHEEYRIGGRLVWIKVTPQYGRPYYLVADPAHATFIRRDSLDTGLRVPMWLLFTF